MRGRLSHILRFARVTWRYPRAGLSFALRALGVVPGFQRTAEYRPDRYTAKQQLKQARQSIGHARERSIAGKLFGLDLFRLPLPEGEIATADQFFLNRPIDDAKHMIALARQCTEIRPGALVFDPGCGAGRHLFHFVDAHGCRGIGVDIYKPAIDVAESANWDRRVRFYAQSSIEPGFLDAILPEGCDFVFINSWLNHVKDYPGYREFIRRIVEKCSFLLVITSAKDTLDHLFDGPDILVHEIRDGTQFALLRGARPQSQPSGT